MRVIPLLLLVMGALPMAAFAAPKDRSHQATPAAAETESDSGFTAVSLGISAPTFMGNAFQTYQLNSPVGVVAEGWMNAGWIAKDLQFHASIGFEPMGIRGTTMGLMTLYGMIGMQIQKGHFTNEWTPFFSADLGAVYAALSMPGTAPGIGNYSTTFAFQGTPGVDIPVYDSFGVVAELPVRFIFSRSILVVLDPTISLRYKL